MTDTAGRCDWGEPWSGQRETEGLVPAGVVCMSRLAISKLDPIDLKAGSMRWRCRWTGLCKNEGMQKSTSEQAREREKASEREGKRESEKEGEKRESDYS